MIKLLLKTAKVLISTEKIKKKFLIERNGYKVYLVDDFIPENEIWIDDILDSKERKYIIFHEFTELKLMKLKHYPYEKAHQIASKKEYEKRKKNGERSN